MALDAIVARFIEHSPVTVMARLALGRALDAQWIDKPRNDRIQCHDSLSPL